MMPRRIIAAVISGTYLAKVNRTALYLIRAASPNQASVNRSNLYVVIPPA